MTDSAFWNNEWMETQKKYWQAWTNMGLNAMGQKIPEVSPWEKALEQWWHTLSPATPDVSKEFINKLMDQSKLFLRMTDNLYRNIESGVNADDWSAIVQKTFVNPMEGLATMHSNQEDAMRQMFAFWKSPVDNWQQLVESLALMSGESMRNLPQDQMQESLQRLLSMPGLGYNREKQAQYQKLLRCGIQYQNATREYTQFFSNLGIKSNEQLRKRLEQLGTNGTVIDSARSLYDLWVGCCEDVYAQQVQAPEYAILHGKLVNTLMALKHQLSTMIDENLGGMNMPTKAELRTLQDRLQETRRENKKLRHDLEALKDLVAALDAGTTPALAVALAAGTTTTKQVSAARRKASVAKADFQGE